jgi:hypothetical protein
MPPPQRCIGIADPAMDQHTASSESDRISAAMEGWPLGNVRK